MWCPLCWSLSVASGVFPFWFFSLASPCFLWCHKLRTARSLVVAVGCFKTNFGHDYQGILLGTIWPLILGFMEGHFQNTSWRSLEIGPFVFPSNNLREPTGMFSGQGELPSDSAGNRKPETCHLGFACHSPKVAMAMLPKKKTPAQWVSKFLEGLRTISLPSTN